MKVLLIVVGVLFLLLALAMFVAAAVVFLVARSRRAKGVPAPDATQPASGRPAAVQPAPPPQPPPPTHDPGGTVMIDSRRGQVWGSLHGTSGPLAGRAYPVDGQGFYIGRDPTLSQVVIESASVSKRHVWIGVRDGAVMAIDQSSTNGTYLNDPKTSITEVRLSPGDTLILSDDIARFTYRA